MTCGRKIIPRASCFLASFCLFAAAISQSEPSGGAYIQKAGAEGVPVTLSMTVLDEKGMPVQELKKVVTYLAPPGGGTRTLEVAVARPGVTIRARREITVSPRPGDAR